MAGLGFALPSVHGMARGRRYVDSDLLAVAADSVIEQLCRVIERLTPGASSIPLKPPTFNGEDEVQVFIQQFRDVATVNEWAERK